MPIYIYQCCTCGVRIERTMNINDKHPASVDYKHDRCAGEVFRRVFTSPSICLTGSGWTTTLPLRDDPDIDGPQKMEVPQW